MATYPKVRGACEYCHRRKIRCILPPDSNACHNCAATRTTCLFAPRAKAGRPRRPTGEPSQLHLQPSLESEAVEPTEASESSEEQHDTLEFNSSSAHSTTEDQWNLSNDVILSKGLQLPSQILFPFNKPQWHDFAHLNDLSIPSTPGAHGVLQGPGPPTPPVTSASTVTLFSGTSNPSSGNLTPAISQSGLANDSDWTDISTPATPLDFELALRLCADLDQRCRTVKETNCLLDAEGHLQALDSVCMASIKTQPSSDSAGRALILAALHKALEICDVLVHAHPSGARNSDTIKLQQLLLLKRLDIVVTFGRICFMRMGQATGMKTAEDIHVSIERRLRSEYGHWAW